MLLSTFKANHRLTTCSSEQGKKTPYLSTKMSLSTNTKMAFGVLGQRQRREWGKGFQGPRMHHSNTAINAFATLNVDCEDTFIWEQAILLTRQLRIAVKEERFQVAANLRDRLTHVLAGMSSAMLFQFIHVQTLMQAEDSSKTLNALSNLERSGDLRALAWVSAISYNGGGGGGGGSGRHHKKRIREAAMQAASAIRARIFSPRAVHLCSQADNLLVQLQFKASSEIEVELGERASELYSAALIEDAQCSMAYAGRGAVSYCLGRYKAAVIDLDQALAMEPNHRPTLRLLVLARGQLKQFDAARRSIMCMTPMDREDVELERVLDRWERERDEWVRRYRRARGDADL